ncbi:hypothetical protein QLS31_13325 [Flavobacterium sp. XS2P24]|uniref:hypothetical protein n=1 Tax=Flavobacterium sp. XS2P24 TaxID=3041249 RepID=UPI0024A9A6F3|nr:hypothetical protein [Flavobacterium sp. XS2P24]MDI6050810.1 hypothetical protein [Flavobacterium sp. XS2P24]
MKNILLKLYCTLFCLLSSAMVFAQVGDDTPDGDLEGGEPPMPINGKLIFLAIAGIIFAYYTFRKNRKEQTI